MKRAYIIILLLVLAVMVCCMVLMNEAYSEEEEEMPLVYAMSKNLLGRIRPGKKYEALTSFDIWTPLRPTGRMSEDRMWIEVKTWESELVWVSINYVTETRDVIRVYTLWDEGVKIRSKPGAGKTTGIAKKEQILEITQVVMGYGRCSKGWVEMDYFIQDCE